MRAELEKSSDPLATQTGRYGAADIANGGAAHDEGLDDDARGYLCRLDR